MLKKPNNPVFPVLFFLLAAAVMMYSGCASIKPEQTRKSDREALETAQRLFDFNREIKASKGRGLLTIAAKNRRIQYRIAWAAESPDRARITLISSGIPVETLLFNKSRITLYSHTGQHSLKTYKSDDPSLERILSVPVKMSDIISVLTGKIPVKPYDYAWFKETDSKKEPRSILLNVQSEKRMQQLIIDSDGGISEFSLLEGLEQPVYKVGFSGLQKFDSNSIFTRMAIKSESGETAVFRIQAFQKNPEMKDSVFNLTKAGQ